MPWPSGRCHAPNQSGCALGLCLSTGAIALLSNEQFMDWGLALRLPGTRRSPQLYLMTAKRRQLYCRPKHRPTQTLSSTQPLSESVHSDADTPRNGQS